MHKSSHVHLYGIIPCSGKILCGPIFVDGRSLPFHVFNFGGWVIIHENPRKLDLLKVNYPLYGILTILTPIWSTAFEVVLSYCRTQYFPFLACLAKVGPTMDPETGERCAEKNDMTWDKINTCYQGDQGHSWVTLPHSVHMTTFFLSSSVVWSMSAWTCMPIALKLCLTLLPPVSVTCLYFVTLDRAYQLTMILDCCSTSWNLTISEHVFTLVSVVKLTYVPQFLR